MHTNFCISQRPPTVLITQRESTKNRQKHLCFYQLHLNDQICHTLSLGEKHLLTVKRIRWEKRQIEQLQEMLKCLISKLKNRKINTDAVTAKISELEMAFKEIFDNMLKKTPKKTQDKL